MRRPSGGAQALHRTPTLCDTRRRGAAWAASGEEDIVAIARPESAGGVLAGVRVLDYGRYVAGPYCATLLGYLGAEVIRVEKRDGSEDRYIAPLNAAGEGAVLLQTGCNKKSLTLEPTTPEGRAVTARLVRSADVVVANLPAATLQAMGLDHETATALNPRIILATQTAFGERGPYAARGGFDGIGQALSGAMYMTGTPGAPAKAAAPYVDFSTAVLSAFGVLAALIQRGQTGRGQRVEATLLGTALAVFNSHLVEQSVLAVNRVGTGNRVQTSAPSDVFATRDGHVLLHVVGNGLFRRWARLVGDEERWTRDPLYQSDQSRADHADAILARAREWCAARTTAEVVAECERAGLPAGAVQTLQQALDDPQVAAMGFLRQVDYPGLPRPAAVADLPVRLSAGGGGITRRPPTLGEHTDEVLGSIGYSTAEIADLRARRIV
ncbi:MAG: CoA transferase [Proteobacteria bacterium]|nr:CoA transferase [Pseudomonadota bacterium]